MAIYTLKTTANREDQVMDFLVSHAQQKELNIYAVVRPHGLRGYIFVEAEDKDAVEAAVRGIPYAKGVLDKLPSFGIAIRAKSLFKS